jgi:hypothetical protein
VEIVPLKLCYKGGRDYLHGTDLYSAIVGHVGEKISDLSRFELFIHKVIRKQCDIAIYKSDEEFTKPDNAVAFYAAYSSDKSGLRGCIIENDSPVECRYEYDEAKVERLCTVNGQMIKMEGDSGYLPVEVAVSMTKQLHQALFPLAEGEKWVFTRLELGRLFDDADALRLRIELLRNMNNNLTKSRMTSGSEEIGHIYFSALRQ